MQNENICKLGKQQDICNLKHYELKHNQNPIKKPGKIEIMPKWARLSGPGAP